MLREFESISIFNNYPNLLSFSQLHMKVLDVLKERFNKYIPADLKEGAVFVNQRFVDKKVDYSNYFGAEQEYLRKAEDLLDNYSKNARLVITTALHCASPCTALGIPVVLIDIQKSNARFDFLEDIIPVYKITDLQNSNIDWTPSVPDIESLKKDILENLRLSIREQCGDNIDEKNLNELRKNISQFKIKY